MPKKIPKAEWDKVAEWWDQEAGDKGVWHQQHDIDPAVFKILGNIKNKKILEIGCGNGYFTRMMTKKGAKVTATDISKKMIELAKEKEKTKPLGIKYLIRDAANLTGVKSNSFDFVVANMCLMDIANAKKTIKEASRVLKDKGLLIFAIVHPTFGHTYQKWVYTELNGKQYFAKAVCQYLSSTSNKQILWASGKTATQYHRSIDTYMKYLRDAEFLVRNFKEIATKKTVKKATKEHKNPRYQRSRYTKISEIKLKESAGKEIPLFLLVGAVKSK